jgi:UDP-glucose 4-epimerase
MPALVEPGSPNMLIKVFGKRGQIGRSIQNSLELNLEKINEEYRGPETLFIAAGNSNSSLLESDISQEFQRFSDCTKQWKLDKYPRVILISSGGSVYGEDFSEAIFEDQLTNPKTPYGKLKIECEELIKEYSQIHDFQLFIARLANVYSAKLNGIIGVILSSLQSSAGFKLRSRIDSTKQYGHVDDYSQVLLNLIISPGFWTEAPKVNTINIFPTLSYSIQDLVSICERFLRKELRYELNSGENLKRNSIILGTRNKHFTDVTSSITWRSVETFLQSELTLRP